MCAERAGALAWADSSVFARSLTRTPCPTSTLSMKQLRRLLEQDLARGACELDGPPHKEYISSKVDEVVKLLLQKQLEDALAAHQGAAHKPKLGTSERGQQLKALLKAATVTCVCPGRRDRGRSLSAP